MSETPCGQACGQSCASGPDAGCPAHAPPGLDDILTRFWREASQGVCPTPRYRMPYFSWGSGPPLVLVHGVGDTRWSFLFVVARLARHFRCIAYDLPGGPGDGARLGRYRHEHLALDLRALLDHLALDRSYVLASSFGSTVALRALAALPDRLPRAVLQGGLAYRPLRRAERWLSALARSLPFSAAHIPKRLKILHMVHGAPFARQPPDVWQAFVTWTGRARLRAMGWQTGALHQLDLRDLLPAVRQPVLLVHGDRDSVVPLPHAQMLQRGLPCAGLAVLEGCGHLPAYTHPEVFAEVVREFFTPPAPRESLPDRPGVSARG
jgi:pimeloyl-ACP methyl ester carboxylesterase